MRLQYVMGYYSTFPSAIPRLWAGYSRVTRPSATVHISILPERILSIFLVRLACVRHAASVRPEPGSNSRSKLYLVNLSSPNTILAHSNSSSLINSFHADSVKAFACVFRILSIKEFLKVIVTLLNSVQELTLFIFQCAINSLLGNNKLSTIIDSLFILTHHFVFVNTFFSFFFLL